MSEQAKAAAEDRKPIPTTTKRAVRPMRYAIPVVAVVLALVAGSGAFAYFHQGSIAEEDQGQKVGGGHDAHDSKDGGETRVEVVKPHAGGLERSSIQPGSVHAFDHADLYSKLSGYLQVQNVDIGSRVKKGDLLAVIDDPEIHTMVTQAVAALDSAKSKVKVAEAMIRTAEANREAADALVSQAEIDVKTKEFNATLQKKQLERIKGLVTRNAVEAKLQDEQEDRYDVSASEVSSVKAAVLTAKAQLQAKAALIEQSKADLLEAKAKVEVAEADLKKAQVMAAYTKISAPFDGVVTHRNYHVGDFIRSASDGEGEAVLSVARTDLMRVVIPVPDRDVPFVEVGDKAVVQLDALAGREYHGAVSRYSSSEDVQSRNMRTEVDIPNKDGKLRDGMWGRVTIILEPPTPNCVTVPSASLLDQNSQGEGFVYVVRDGKAHKVAVRVGKDDGMKAEILDGLKADDQVVVRYTGAIQDGSDVIAESAQPAKSGH